MLLAIREYMLKKDECSLAELSTHFHTSTDAMRGMLGHWIRKGQVKTYQKGCTQGCSSCSQEQLESYCWISRTASTTLIPMLSANV